MLWQWRNGVWILNKVYVIGMGPGAYEQMTVAAVEALKGCDVIVGYIKASYPLNLGKGIYDNADEKGAGAMPAGI